MSRLRMIRNSDARSGPPCVALSGGRRALGAFRLMASGPVSLLSTPSESRGQQQKTPPVGDDGRGLFGEPLGAGRMLARTSVSAYGSTVRPFVLSVTVISVNATVIGGLQSGVNVAVSVTV